MKLRKSLILLMVFAFCLSAAVTAFAEPALDPAAATANDAAFISALSGVESYLRINYGRADLGNKALAFMYSNYKTMDVERLSACLTRYLGCSAYVSLAKKLEVYAKDIRSGNMSIAETCELYGIIPEAASDKTYIERANLAADINKQPISPNRASNYYYNYYPRPTGSPCPCPTYAPYPFPCPWR